MTTQQPNSDNLITPEKWEELDFAGKEFCSINEAQELVLAPTAYSPARILSSVNLANCETVTAALAEKFAEVEAKMKELEAEWQQADDKLKHAGKIARLKEYLLHANAIGDYTPFFESLAEKERSIQELYAANYAGKLALAEKAESLKDSDDWKATNDAFRGIIEEWKNAPQVEKHKSEALWERIENARNHFYERKRQHQDEVEKDMMQNLDLKLELCELAESLAASEDWRPTSDKFKDLMERWKKIGRVASAEKNEELWNRFITARNAFFDRKRLHFEHIQQEQEGNYMKKLALVERAESMQDSTDWKATTQSFADLMDEWKKIGRVPIEKADELWERLQASRDKFFSAKRQSAEEYKVSMEDNYAQKLALVNRAEQIQHSDNWREVTDEMNELMQEWKKIGHVAREHSDELWERFIGARNKFFERKDADRDRRKARFRNQAEGRLKQTREFLEKIRTELQEEEDKLADFRESLGNTTGEGAKEEELRKHLENLIRQIENKLPGRRQKIADVAQQLEELEQKMSEPKGKKGE